MNQADERFIRTLENYFDIRIEPDDPLLEEVRVKHLSGGEWLIRQGDSGDALYLLIQGRLQAWAKDPEGEKDAPEQYLGEVAPGDSVGEISLLTGARRAASVKAIRDSMLAEINRTSFEKLAQRHPALVMRLAANVASVLHQSTSGTQAAARNLKTITVLPLDESAKITEFCRLLEIQLENFGPTLRLSAENLEQHDAPVPRLAAEDPVPHTLRIWLHDQESRNRFVVYECSPENRPWTRFVRRQSDLVLMIADTSMDPAISTWENHLAEACKETATHRILVLLQPPASAGISNTAAWLSGRDIDFHLHVREDHPEDCARVGRIIAGQAVGLVLGGGAARGFAHLGVYRALIEAGIPIDWVGGTSIGGIMGAMIASDWTFEKTRQVAHSSFVSGKPFSDFTIPLMSLIRGQRMERLLKTHAGFQIEDMPIPFFCVSCSLDTGEANLHDKGFLPDALRATAAMTGIIPPAVINHRLAVDGSVINNLPIDLMQKKPVGTIIAVDLSLQREYQVDYDTLPSPWAVLRGLYLPFSRRQRVPVLSTILLKCMELGTMAKVRELGKQADLLLKPPVREFSLTDVKSFDQIVEAGYRHAKEELGAWQAVNDPAE